MNPTWLLIAKCAYKKLGMNKSGKVWLCISRQFSQLLYNFCLILKKPCSHVCSNSFSIALLLLGN